MSHRLKRSGKTDPCGRFIDPWLEMFWVVWGMVPLESKKEMESRAEKCHTFEDGVILMTEMANRLHKPEKEYLTELEVK